MEFFWDLTPREEFAAYIFSIVKPGRMTLRRLP
jgi:hypothetical protein